MKMPSLIESIDGTLTHAEIERLKFPVAWSGTKDAAEGRAEETALHDLADSALAELAEAYRGWRGDLEGMQLAVRFERGESVEIVEISA